MKPDSISKQLTHDPHLESLGGRRPGFPATAHRTRSIPLLPSSDDMKTYWGDLHNHCAASYGQGTPAQALERARQHLDFCTLTGHAFWPDMPMDLATQNVAIGMHLGGFAKLRHYWRSMLAELASANQPGRFVTLPSYEWHSMEYGDYNCYAPHHELELIDGPDLPTLAAKIAEQNPQYMLLPHHCAYAAGFRGTNWRAFDGRRSPLVEIYSNHGCGEADDAPFDYHHSMGPRTAESMVRTALASGHRFGFYASTDSHDGYPGHYGHGKVGVMATRLDLPSIWAGLVERRTVASTGARFAATVDAGDGGIGTVLRRGKRRDVIVKIEGSAPIDAVDLIEGGAGEWRVRRLGAPPVESAFTAGRFKVKIEAGWGRGATLSHWRMGGQIKHGRLLGIEPCFRFSSATAATASSEKLERTGTGAFSWSATAVPNPSGAMGGTHFNSGGTQAVVVDVEASSQTRLILDTGASQFDLRLVELARGSFVRHVAGFCSAALKVHRAVPEREFACTLRLPRYRAFGQSQSFAYVRARQADGHTVWISPIWFE